MFEAALTYLTDTLVWHGDILTSLNMQHSAVVVPLTDLPALVPELAASGGEGFAPLDLSLVYGLAVVFINHKLLIKGLGVGGAGDGLAALPGLIDDYLASLAGEWSLNNNLAAPLAVVGISAGTIEQSGVVYFGCTFRHRWEIRV